MTRKEYQNRGIGTKVFNSNVKANGRENIILDAVMEKVHMYKRIGYTQSKLYFYTVTGIPNLNIISQYSDPSIDILSIKDEIPSDVIDYDSSVHKIPRENFLRVWISSRLSSAYCAVKNGVVVGYGVLRKEQPGDPDRLSGLYGDTPLVARLLLMRLLKDATKETVKIIVPYVPHSRELINDIGISFLELPTSVRMYTQHDIPIAIDKVYSMMNNINLIA